MKLSLLVAVSILSVGSFSMLAMADSGDSADRNGVLEVAGQKASGAKAQGSASYGGQTASTETYCTDRPERCSAAPVRAGHKARKIAVKLVSTAAGCSTGGDQTARPVYASVDGVTVFAGYECIQDNRSSGN